MKCFLMRSGQILGRPNLRCRHGILAIVVSCSTLLILCIGFAFRALGEDAPPSQEAPLRFRRVFVPADHADAWPRNGEKFLPIESRDFDKWIDAANRPMMREHAEVTISAAQYTGQLNSLDGMDGKALWTIELHGDKPAILPLGEISLDVEKPRWQDPSMPAARFGRWAKNASTPDQLGLEVPKSGTLEFKWRLHGKQTPAGLVLPWQVPAASTEKLSLDLPDGKRPDMARAIVQLPSAGPSAALDSPSRRLWHIALGPSTDSQLRIVDSKQGPAETVPSSTIADDISYRITQRGLEIVSNWHLVVENHSSRQATLRLPRGVELLSVATADHELRWRIVGDTTSESSSALIELPEAAHSGSLSLTLRAWQPLIPKRAWKLPQLRPDGFYWTAGKIELSIAPELELVELNPVDCVQTGVTLADESNGPEMYWFTEYEASAGVELTIAHREPATEFRIMSSLALTDQDINGKLTTRCNVSRGQIHRLFGQVSPGWVVEAVETAPPDALAEWFINRRNGRSEIEVQLARGAEAGRNVSIIVTGRLQQFGLTAPITSSTLQMVKWHPGVVARHLLAIQTVEPFAIEAVGDLPEMRRETLSAADLQLLDPAVPANVLFDLTQAGKQAGLQLTFKRAQYDADVSVSAVCAGRTVREEFRVIGDAKATPVDRLLIYSTGSLVDVRWLEKSSAKRLIAERVPANDPLRKGLPEEGELWSLQLAERASTKFEVDGSCTVALAKRVELPLLSLPEAVRQTGNIAVRSDAAANHVPESQRLTSIPLPGSDENATQTGSIPVRAAYRYEPADCLDATKKPRLWLSSHGENETGHVARYLRIESFFWPDGRAAHRATYLLENTAAGAADLQFAPAEKLISAAIDGQPLDVVPSNDPGQGAKIRLPFADKQRTLLLCFETQAPPLSTGASLLPAGFDNGITVLAGEWLVALPEEFSAEGTALAASDQKFNWRRRLFGVLGRPNNIQPFQPLSATDWTRVFGGFGGSSIDLPGTEVNSALQTGDTPSSSQRNSKSATNVSRFDLPGWRLYRESFVADPPESLVVANPHAIAAWSVAVFLTFLFVGKWLRARGRALFATVLAIAAAAAICAPAPYPPTLSAIVLGLAGSLIFAWFKRPLAVGEMYPPWNRRAIASVLIVSLVTGATTIAIAQGVIAPDAPARSTSARDSIHRVLIPIDNGDHPVGTKYYVSEAFLRILMRDARPRLAATGQWLLLDAEYSGDLRMLADQPDTLASNWDLKFVIETIARDTTIVLPLTHNDADWPATASLDGIPTPLEWKKNKNGCAIKVPEPGRYSLSISCLPHVIKDAGQNRLTLSIPPLPSATLHLRYPSAVAGLSVNQEPIGPITNSIQGAFEAQLGERGQLALQWNSLNTAGPGVPGLNVTEMRWLQIGASDIELETKYIIEGRSARPDALTIAFDSRWKLLTKVASVPQQEEQKQPADRTFIRIPLSPDDLDRQEVLLRWKWVESNTIGNLQLPPIELTSLPVTQRWFAVSTDPALECAPADGAISNATENEFLELWGSHEPTGSLQLVLAKLDPGRPRQITIRPRAAESVVDETLHVAVGRNALRTAYTAKIKPGPLEAYRFQLLFPSDLSIDDIAITQSGQRIPARWSRTAQDHVNVFFAQKLTEPFQLTLVGKSLIGKGNTASLPRISAVSTENAAQEIHVYRDDDVQVDVSGVTPGNNIADGSKSQAPPDWTARHIAAYRLDRSLSQAARINIRPSEPQVVGDSLTLLTREGGNWIAGFQCHLVVERGNLDTLRLSAPAAWRGPFEIRSNNSATVKVSPAGEGQAVLSLRLEKTVEPGRSLDLYVAGPLQAPTASSIMVPDIRLEALNHGHNYVWVPNKSDVQRLVWNVDGVRAASIPHELLPAGAELADGRAFEVIAPKFRISGDLQPLSPSSARIRLADTKIAVGDRGGQLIETRVVLDSKGLPELTVRLPSDQELVSVTLDGRPALAFQTAAMHWRVSLGPPQLPQVLEIVSRSMGQGVAPKRLELRRPALQAGNSSIPVDVSLWTFSQPTKAECKCLKNAAPVSELDQAQLRLDRMVSFAEAALPAVVELGPVDGNNWFRTWAELLNSIRNDTVQVLNQPSLSDRAVLVSPASEEQINQASQRLDKWLEQCRATVGVSDHDSPRKNSRNIEGFTTFSTGPSGAGDRTYYVAEGGADHIALEIIPLVPSATRVQILALLAIAALLAASIWLSHSPAGIEFLIRWPHAVAIGVGIVYWAWLWPSWLGLLLAIGGLFFAVRTSWFGHPPRADASTVVRPKANLST
jgi:hypothetical protein